MAIFSAAFLRVRLLVDKSCEWMPPLGRRIAEDRIKPRWFNVIRLHEIPPRRRIGQADILVAVSHQKPSTNDYSIPLYPNTDGKRPPVHVNPAFPDDVRLYIRTDMRFMLSYKETDSWPVDHFYSMTNEDATTIQSYVVQDFYAQISIRRELAKEIFGSGGDEIPMEDWSSFGPVYSNNIGDMHDRLITFEYTPMEIQHTHESFVDDIIAKEQIDTLRRIWADYSWPGVHGTIDWVYNLTNTGVPVRQIHTTDSDQCVPIDHLLTLSKIENPHPGDPPPPKPVSDDDSDDIDWDESGSFAVRYEAANVGPPQFTPSPSMLSAVQPAEDVRIMCFDICGTLVDREQAVKSALKPLLSESAFASIYTLDDAYSQYIESEAEEATSSAEAERTYDEVLEAALAQFVSSLGLEPLTKQRMDIVMAKMGVIPVFDEASQILRSLKDAGVRIVAAPLMNTALLNPALKTLEDRSGVAFDCILSECTPLQLHGLKMGDSVSKGPPTGRGYIEDLSGYAVRTLGESYPPNQVVFVTTSGWRSRLATEAGFTTVRVGRNGSLEGTDTQYEAAGVEPTFKLGNMQMLPEVIGKHMRLSAE